MWDTIRAVLWGFLGIRSGKGYDEDRKKLKLHHVIIAGVVCAISFVLLLVFVVKLVTSK
jgi:hypothetical protein